MDFPSVSLLLDFGFACLLIVVLVYAIRLNGHITKLQNSKAELEVLLRGFVTATERAESAVQRLKESSQTKTTDLESALSKGKHLHSDLSFMSSRADEIATRLENAIRAGRSMAGNAIANPALEAEIIKDKMPSEALVAEERNELSQTSAVKGKSKSDLLKALQGMR